MAADVGFLVGAHDHGHGVPADVAVNLDFHVRIAGVFRLLIGGNGVDVFGIGRVGQINAGFAGLADDLFDQVVSALSAFLGDDAIERLHPFFGFLGIYVRRVR